MAHALRVGILTHSFRPTVNLLCQIGWQSERVHVALDGRWSLGFRLRHARSLPLFRPCLLSSAKKRNARDVDRQSRHWAFAAWSHGREYAHGSQYKHWYR